jgi:hypothetical protein
MHVQERRAWYALGIASAALVAYFVLLAAGLPRSPAAAALSLAALFGFLPLVGRRGARSGDVLVDERDREIARSAALISLSALWVLFVAVAVAAALALGADRTVGVTGDGLYAGVIVSLCVLYLVRAVVIVALYRRDSGGAES